MEQIRTVADAGADLVRVAVPREKDADALRTIVAESPIPVIADIHFNASLALKAIEAGVAAVRINPGNIGGPDKVELVVRAAKSAGIPMRIGANSGSLPKHLHALAQQDQAEALVAAALEEVELLEKLEYRDFKISVKATHVPTMIRAYRMLSAKVPYPLHLGVTEAGTEFAGAIKSSVGIGSLLADGIGDTLRVSLTADPVKEVEVAWEILKALGLRERGPVMIACPSCGRDNVGVESLARVVEERLRLYPEAFEVVLYHLQPGTDPLFARLAARADAVRLCPRWLPSRIAPLIPEAVASGPRAGIFVATAVFMVAIVVALVISYVLTRHLPVIVVTGEMDEILETQLLEEGADDYIRKPVDPRLFLARVEATIRRTVA